MARVLDLADVLELIDDRLNGLITNDKFCWSRRGRLRLSWPHYPLRERDRTARRETLSPVEDAQRGGSDETAVVHPSRRSRAPGRPAAVGSGLPAVAGLGASAAGRPDSGSGEMR